MGKQFKAKSRGGKLRKVKKEFSPRTITERAKRLRSTPQRVLPLEKLENRKLTFKREGNGSLLRIGIEGGFSCVYSKRKDKRAAIGDVIGRYGGERSGIGFQNSFTGLFQQDLKDGLYD